MGGRKISMKMKMKEVTCTKCDGNNFDFVSINGILFFMCTKCGHAFNSKLKDRIMVLKENIDKLSEAGGE